MAYVLVVVSTEDMEGKNRLEVLGPFETEKEAEAAKPLFYRSTKQQTVKQLTAPKK